MERLERTDAFGDFDFEQESSGDVIFRSRKIYSLYLQKRITYNFRPST